MSYPSTALNIKDRNLLVKPKPLYKQALEEEKNSIGSPTPPRYPFLPESHPYPNHRGYGLVGNSFGNSGNLPEYFRVPPYSGLDPYGFIPYNFECRPAHLPAVVNGSHGRFHPYYYGHMKVAPPMPGFEHYFLTNFRKPKRVRTAFNPNQLLTLEKAFERNHYVVGNERKQLSQILDLSETQVKVWFQNRRTKHKRQKQDGQSCSSKSNGKDCLDSRETSSEEPTTSDEDEEEVPSPSETPSPSEIVPGTSLEKCRNSIPLVSATENPIPVVSATESPTPVVIETPIKAISSKIWNPISMLRTE